jgi:hypothetical protein
LASIERCSDHWKIISVAGWSYRTNDRGWMIYHDPQANESIQGSFTASILAKSNVCVGTFPRRSNSIIFHHSAEC